MVFMDCNVTPYYTTTAANYSDGFTSYSYGTATSGIVDCTSDGYTLDYGYGKNTTSASTWPINAKVRVKYNQWADAGTNLYHYINTTSWDYVQGDRIPPKSIEDRMSEIIRNRVSPNIITRRTGMNHAGDIREMRARETLRRVVGDQKFFSFLKKGFVTVAAKSGLVYQIYPSHGITKVWDGGTVVERLCVVLRGDFPPTDSLIMRYLMILNNEDNFRSLAIKHTVLDAHQPSHAPRIEVAKESLVDLFSDLKKRFAA